MKEPFIILDKDIISYANSEAAKLFKYEDDKQLLDTNIFELSSGISNKHNIDRIRYNFFSNIDNENTTRFKWIFKRADGTKCYSEVIHLGIEKHSDNKQFNFLLINDLSDISYLKNANSNSISHIMTNLDKAVLLIEPLTGKIIEANKNAANLYQYSIETLKTMNISDINILSKPEIKNEMEKAKKEQRNHFIFPHKTSKGEILNVKVLSGPVTYKNRQILFSIITQIENQFTMIENSDSKKLPLKNYIFPKNKFKQLFHNLQFPTIITDNNFKFKEINNAFTREFGYSKPQLKNHTVNSAICPPEEFEENDFFHSLLIQNNNLFHNMNRKDINGKKKTYRINAFPIFKRKKLYGFGAAYVDIDSDIKIRKRLELIEKMTATIKDAMIITDAEKKIIWTNNAFEKITGYNIDMIKGKSPSFLKDSKYQQTFYKHIFQEVERQGEWAGEITNRNKANEIFKVWLSISEIKNTLGYVTNFLGVMHDITDFKAQEKIIKKMAEIDHLTGLINRPVFTKKGELILKQNKKAAVAFIDFDDFKIINDTYGHDTGDKVLEIIAHRISGCLKKEDLISRFGGDEFNLLLPDVSSNEINDITRRIFSIVVEKIETNVFTITPSISMGIAFYPDDGKTITELLKASDIALYKAKKIKGCSSHNYNQGAEYK